MTWIIWIVLVGLVLLIGIYARQSTKYDQKQNGLSRQQRQENEQLIREKEQKREDNIERHNMRLISLETARTVETRRKMAE